MGMHLTKVATRCSILCMEDYPRTLLEFDQRFATEESCRAYLAQLRWPDGFRCPRCSHEQSWPLRGDLLQCKRCDHQTSVTAGTIFHRTRKPLRVWFRAMWYVTNQKHGVSALGVQRVLGLGSYRTAWMWLHKLRRAMVRPGLDRLSGIMQVDEVYMGGEKSGKRGRGAAGKTLILVAVQEDGKKIGRIRMRCVANASAKSLEPAVLEAVELGSCICTDGWIGYNGLEALGYVHEVVRKKSSVGEEPLPKVNLVVSLLKRWITGTLQGGISPSYLDYYLDEFTFRFNRRTSRSRGKLFYRLVQQAAAFEPISGSEILW